MKNTNISFVIPAYNCAKFLPDTINSIFDGNFTVGDEIIIIDDASTDNTFKIVERLQKKYPQIRIYRHHYNKGSAAAGRNTGIDNSKNELIFCLDADNILCPNSVTKLKKHMIINNADVASFGELHYFIKNKKVTHKWIFNDEIHFGDCLKNSKFPGASGNYLFTKASWIRAGRYNESVGGACDSWAFGFYQLATGSKMITMPNSFYYHRYGYRSAYVRDSANKNISLTILQIILPYIHLFEGKDANYIMSNKWRYSWFNNIEKHPIRLKRHDHSNLLNKIRSWPIATKLKSYFE